MMVSFLHGKTAAFGDTTGCLFKERRVPDGAASSSSDNRAGILFPGVVLVFDGMADAK